MSSKTKLGKTFNVNFNIFLSVCVRSISAPALCQWEYYMTWKRQSRNGLTFAVLCMVKAKGYLHTSAEMCCIGMGQIPRVQGRFAQVCLLLLCAVLRFSSVDARPNSTKAAPKPTFALPFGQASKSSGDKTTPSGCPQAQLRTGVSVGAASFCRSPSPLPPRRRRQCRRVIRWPLGCFHRQ